MRWWWFGPAVTKAELEREMRLMKEGGIGGFEVQPVYPLAWTTPPRASKTSPTCPVNFSSLRSPPESTRTWLAHGSNARQRLAVRRAAGLDRDAAGKLRSKRVVARRRRRMPVPDIGAGERLLAVFLAPHAGPNARMARPRGDRNRGGRRTLPETAGSHEVLFFISSRSGMMVKRAAVGAEGFVLNHYDRAAVEQYSKNVGDRLLQVLRRNRRTPSSATAWRCTGLDRPTFSTSSKKRRGYDLKPLLAGAGARRRPGHRGHPPRLGPDADGVVRRTFMAPMHDGRSATSTLFRIQGYGMPPATISSNACADLPEGEGSAWKTVRASRWAASASHLLGGR